MKSIIFIVLFLIFCGCTPKRARIMQGNWKYQEGYYLGDVFYFDGGYYSIDEEGKIYVEDRFVATMKDLQGRELTIVSLEGEVGSYLEI
jgi:hypothetical protein